MTKEQDKILEIYYREIRSYFPVYNTSEKRYFNDVKNLVSEYIYINDGFTAESLRREVGEPKDVVSRYLMEVDAEVLRKSMSFSKHVRRAIIVGLCIIIVTCLAKFGLFYKNYLEAKDAYINKEVIDIEEGGELK